MVRPSTTLTVNFGGASIASNTTNYDESATINPSTLLFPNATVVTTGPGNSSNLSSLTLAMSNPSATETVALNSDSLALANSSDIEFSYVASTGVISLTYTGNGNGPSDATWSAILDGITYNNTSDEPLGTTHTITLTGATNHDGAYGSTTSGHETIDVTCFYAGTMIRTPDGEEAVETLQPGDLVLTAEGVAAPVRWLGRQTVSVVFADKLRVLPIRIREGALGENVPSRDLLVSPDHALFVDGVLAQAGALVNERSIVREINVPGVFTYYHIELDEHALIFAENTLVESFVDNVDRIGFDNWREHEALYPTGKSVADLPYPRAKAYRQVPTGVRAKLSARANAIGAAIAAVA